MNMNIWSNHIFELRIKIELYCFPFTLIFQDLFGLSEQFVLRIIESVSMTSCSFQVLKTHLGSKYGHWYKIKMSNKTSARKSYHNLLWIRFYWKTTVRKLTTRARNEQKKGLLIVFSFRSYHPAFAKSVLLTCFGLCSCNWIAWESFEKVYFKITLNLWHLFNWVNLRGKSVTLHIHILGEIR